MHGTFSCVLTVSEWYTSCQKLVNTSLTTHTLVPSTEWYTSCQKLVNTSLTTHTLVPSTGLPSFPITVASKLTFIIVGSLKSSIMSSLNRNRRRYTCFQKASSKSEERSKGTTAAQGEHDMQERIRNDKIYLKITYKFLTIRLRYWHALSTWPCSVLLSPLLSFPVVV